MTFEFDYSISVTKDNKDKFEVMNSFILDMDVHTIWDNDGIGPHDYMGKPCNDKGHNYIAVDYHEEILVQVKHQTFELAKKSIEIMFNFLEYKEREIEENQKISLALDTIREDNGLAVAKFYWQNA